MNGSRVEVAQVVTRFIAGAGGVALRGALHLDTDRYRTTIVTGEGGPLADRAREAGMNVLIEPSLVSPISPRNDAVALARLTSICHEHEFDVVHTHSAKAGALGRVAAHRAGVPVVVHTYHGFPFHDFQDPVRHAAYVAIERRLARITDHVLAIGTGVAAEALRVLTDPAHAAAVRRDLHDVRGRLGTPGASRRAAEAVLEVAAGGIKPQKNTDK